MVTARDFVNHAQSGDYLGISYDKLDCQAFVEKVLADTGYRYDWRGSNDMWRNAVRNRAKIENADDIPAGAWVFTIKQDGGEKERGYYDNMGNATHVGIYLGDGAVIHSTSTKSNGKSGVQMDKITSKRWTDYALCKYINYEETGNTAADLRDLVKQLSKFPLSQVIDAIRAEWG